MIQISFLEKLYPEVDRGKIKIKWSNSKLSKMYKEGYKYCTQCIFMIKIDELFCRNCGKMFRCRPRSTSNLYNIYSESIYKPITISLKRRDLKR